MERSHKRTRSELSPPAVESERLKQVRLENLQSKDQRTNIRQSSRRKIPQNLTSSAGLYTVAALFVIFLFGMELNHYNSMSTSTSLVVDKSSDGDFLCIGFNISFPALSCEFASVDVSDVLGTVSFYLRKHFC